MKMEATSVEKLARVLKMLVIIVFVCNLIALLLVPSMALLQNADSFRDVLQDVGAFGTMVWVGWIWLWHLGAYGVVLAVFLWICGISTAVILWQAKKVLDRIIGGELFSFANAAHLRRAAICSFIISAVSLLWAVCRAVLGGIAELLALSTLFFPVFFLAALLFLVMSALFRQAAKLKEENDLTI